MSEFGQYPEGDIDINPASVSVRLASTGRSSFRKEVENYLYDSSPNNVDFPVLRAKLAPEAYTEYLLSQGFTTDMRNKRNATEEVMGKSDVVLNEPDDIDWLHVSSVSSHSDDFEYVDSRQVIEKQPYSCIDAMKEYGITVGQGSVTPVFPFQLGLLPAGVSGDGDVTDAGLVMKGPVNFCTTSNAYTLTAFLQLQLAALPTVETVLFRGNEDLALSITAEGQFVLQGKVSVGGVRFVPGKLQTVQIRAHTTKDSAEFSVTLNDVVVLKCEVEEPINTSLVNPTVFPVGKDMVLRFVSLSGPPQSAPGSRGGLHVTRASLQASQDRFLDRDKLSLRPLYVYAMACWESPLWQAVVSVQGKSMPCQINFAYICHQYKDWFGVALNRVYPSISSAQWEGVINTASQYAGATAKRMFRCMTDAQNVASLRVNECVFVEEDNCPFLCVKRTSTTTCSLTVSTDKPEHLVYMPSRHMTDGSTQFMHSFIINNIPFDHISNPLNFAVAVHGLVTQQSAGAFTERIACLSGRRWVDLLQEALQLDAATQAKYAKWAAMDMLASKQVGGCVALIRGILQSAGVSASAVDTVFATLCVKLLDLTYSDLHAIGLPYEASARSSLASRVILMQNVVTALPVNIGVLNAVKYRCGFLHDVLTKPRYTSENEQVLLDPDYVPTSFSTEFHFADFLKVRPLDLNKLTKLSERAESTNKYLTRKEPHAVPMLPLLDAAASKLDLLSVLREFTTTLEAANSTEQLNLRACIRQSLIHQITVTLPFPCKDSVWDTVWSVAELTQVMRFLFFLASHVTSFFLSRSEDRHVLLGALACMADFLIHAETSERASNILPLLEQFGMHLAEYDVKTGQSTQYNLPELVVLRTRVIEYLTSTTYKHEIFTWGLGDVDDDLLLLADVVCAKYCFSAPSKPNEEPSENVFVLLNVSAKNTQTEAWELFELYRDLSFMFRSAVDGRLTTALPFTPFTFRGENKRYIPTWCKAYAPQETVFSPSSAQFYVNDMTKLFQVSKTTKLTPYSAVTEEEVNNLNELPKMNDQLSENDIHRLLSVLAVPAMRLGLVLDFYSQGRWELVKDDLFFTLIRHVLLEPGMYTSDDTTFDSVPAAPELVGARWGALFQELTYNPQVFITLVQGLRSQTQNSPSSLYSGRSAVLVRWIEIVSVISDYAQYLVSHDRLFNISEHNLTLVRNLVADVDDLFQEQVLALLMQWGSTLKALANTDFRLHFKDITESRMSASTIDQIGNVALARFREDQLTAEERKDMVGMGLDDLIRSSFDNGHLNAQLLAQSIRIITKLIILSARNRDVDNLAFFYAACVDWFSSESHESAVEKSAFQQLNEVNKKLSIYSKADANRFLERTMRLLADKVGVKTLELEGKEWVGPMTDKQQYFRLVPFETVKQYPQSSELVLPRLNWDVDNSGAYIVLAAFTGLVTDSTATTTTQTSVFNPINNEFTYLQSFFADVEQSTDGKYTKTTIPAAGTVMHVVDEPALPESTLLLELPYFLHCDSLLDRACMPKNQHWVVDLLRSRYPNLLTETSLFFNAKDISGPVVHLFSFLETGIQVYTCYRQSRTVLIRTIRAGKNSLYFAGSVDINQSYRLVTRAASSRFNLQSAEETVLPSALLQSILPPLLTSQYQFSRAGDNILGYPLDLRSCRTILEVSLTPASKSQLQRCSIKRRALTKEELTRINMTDQKLQPVVEREMVLVDPRSIAKCGVKKVLAGQEVLFWSEDGILSTVEGTSWGTCSVRDDKLYPTRYPGYFVEEDASKEMRKFIPSFRSVLRNDFGAQQVLIGSECYAVHASGQFLEPRSINQSATLFLHYLNEDMFDCALHTLESMPRGMIELSQASSFNLKSFSHAAYFLKFMDRMQSFGSNAELCEGQIAGSPFDMLNKHLAFSTRPVNHILSTDLEIRYLQCLFLPSSLHRLYQRTLYLSLDEHVQVALYNRLQFLLAVTANMDCAYRMVLPTYKYPTLGAFSYRVDIPFFLTCLYNSSVYRTEYNEKFLRVQALIPPTRPQENMYSLSHYLYTYICPSFTDFLKSPDCSFKRYQNGYTYVFRLLCSGNYAEFMLGRSIAYAIKKEERRNLISHLALLLANSPEQAAKVNVLDYTPENEATMMSIVFNILEQVVPVLVESPELFNTYCKQVIDRPVESYVIGGVTIGPSVLLSDTAATNRVTQGEHSVWAHPLAAFARYTYDSVSARDYSPRFEILNHPDAPTDVPQCVETMQRMTQDISSFQQKSSHLSGLLNIPLQVADLKADDSWIVSALSTVQTLSRELMDVYNADVIVVENTNKRLFTLLNDKISFVNILPFLASSESVFDLVRRFPALDTADVVYEVLNKVENAAVHSIRSSLILQAMGYLDQIKQCVQTIRADRSCNDAYHVLVNSSNHVAELFLKQRQHVESGLFDTLQYATVKIPDSRVAPTTNEAAPYKVFSSVFYPIEQHEQRMKSIVQHSNDVETDCKIWRVKNSALKFDNERVGLFNKSMKEFNTTVSVPIQGLYYDPTALLVEFSKTILIRKEQLELRDSLVKTLHVQQLLMGAGKTSVVLPLLSLRLADVNRLTVFVVPDALLRVTAETLRSTFNGPVRSGCHVYTFDRNQVVDASMVDNLLRTMATRSVLLTTATSMKSIFLRLVELQNIMIDTSLFARPEHIDLEISILTEVVSMLRSARVVVDEVDLVTHPLLSDLHFPLGSQQDVSRHSARASLAMHMLQPVLDCEYNDVDCGSGEKKQIISKIKHTVADLEQRGALTLRPHLVISEKVVYEQYLRPLFALWAAVYIQPIAQAGVDTLSKFFAGTGPQPTSQSDELVVLAHSWVTVLLPYILRQVNLVHYGLLTTPQLVAALDVNPFLPTTRELTAVPFIAKDTPSRGSEFAHYDVMLGFTVLSYKRQGVGYRLFTKMMRSLKAKLALEDGPMPMRPSFRLFSSFTNIRLDTVSPSSYDDMFDLFHALRRNNAVLTWCLTDFVFSECSRQCAQKLSCTAADLPLLCEEIGGFSGTPSSILPKEMGKCEYQTGADGATFVTLTSPNVHFELLEPSWTSKSLLQLVANAKDANGRPQYRALIDSGALVTGMTNKQVAEVLIADSGLDWAQGVAYIDNLGDLVILRRGESNSVLLHSSGILDKDRFMFYDQAHSTGVDVKHTATARAAVTVSASMTYRDLAQGVYRMRGIGRGQTATLLLPYDVQYMVVARSTGNMAITNAKDIIKMTSPQVQSNLITHLLLTELSLFQTQVQKMHRLDQQVPEKRAHMIRLLFNEGVYTVERFPESAEAKASRDWQIIFEAEIDLQEFIFEAKKQNLARARKLMTKERSQRLAKEAIDKRFKLGFSGVVGKLTSVMQNVRDACVDVPEQIIDADKVMAAAKWFVQTNESDQPEQAEDDFVVLSELYEHCEMVAEEFLHVHREETVTHEEQVQVQVYMRPPVHKFARVDTKWNLELLRSSGAFSKFNECSFAGDTKIDVNLEFTRNFYDVQVAGAQRIKYSWYVLLNQGKPMLISLSEAASLRKLQQQGKLPVGVEVVCVGKSKLPVVQFMSWFNNDPFLTSDQISSFFAVCHSNDFHKQGKFYRMLQSARVAAYPQLSSSVQCTLLFNDVNELRCHDKVISELVQRNSDNVMFTLDPQNSGKISMVNLAKHIDMPVDFTALAMLPYTLDGVLSVDKYFLLATEPVRTSSFNSSTILPQLPRELAQPQKQLYIPLPPVTFVETVGSPEGPRNRWGWREYDGSDKYVEMPGYSDIHVFDVSRGIEGSKIVVDGCSETHYTEEGQSYLFLHPNSKLVIPGSVYASTRTLQSGFMCVLDTDLPRKVVSTPGLRRKYQNLPYPERKKANAKQRSRFAVAQRLASDVQKTLNRARFVFNNLGKFEFSRIEEVIRRDFYHRVPKIAVGPGVSVPEQFSTLYSQLESDAALHKGVARSSYVVEEKSNDPAELALYERRVLFSDAHQTCVMMEGATMYATEGPTKTDLTVSSEPTVWNVLGCSFEAENITTKFNESSNPVPSHIALDLSLPVCIHGGPTGARVKYVIAAPKLMPVRVMSRFCGALIVSDSWVCPCCATVNADTSMLITNCESCNWRKQEDYLSAGEKVCLPCRRVCVTDRCPSCAQPVLAGAELVQFRTEHTARVREELTKRRKNKQIKAQNLMASANIVVDDNDAELDAMVIHMRRLLAVAKKDILAMARNDDRKGERREIAMLRFLQDFGLFFAHDKPHKI